MPNGEAVMGSEFHPEGKGEAAVHHMLNLFEYDFAMIDPEAFSALGSISKTLRNPVSWHSSALKMTDLAFKHLLISQ